MFLKCVVKVHTHIHISVTQIVSATTHRGKSTQAIRLRLNLSDRRVRRHLPSIPPSQRKPKKKQCGQRTLEHTLGNATSWRAKNVPSQRSATKKKPLKRSRPHIEQKNIQFTPAHLLDNLHLTRTTAGEHPKIQTKCRLP